MRVKVAPEQQPLKKQHAGRPDGGAAAEPGQNEFPDQRLNLEKQEGSQKNRDCVCGHVRSKTLE
jgi:hypothetical protein